MKIFLIGLLFLALPIGHASAHATPLVYDPAPSSILQKAPQGVRVQFNERIEPGASSIAVFAPDGSTAAVGTTSVDPENPYLFSVALRPTTKGTYAVSWQTVSADDGHFNIGGFLFSIGKQSANPAAAKGQFRTQHPSDWPAAIANFLELLGQAILLSVLVLVATVCRRTERLFRFRIRMLLCSAAFLTVIGVVGFLCIKSSTLAVDQSSTLPHAFVSFLTTVAARYAVYRLVLTLVLIGGYILWMRSMLTARRFTLQEAIFFLLILSITLLRARVSHAAASEFFPTFSIIVNAVHLLFKELWIGGLVVFLIAVIPVLEYERNARLTLLTMLRFGNLLLTSFAVGGATGAYIIWLHLKSPVNLFTTHWGGYCIALGAFALIFLVLRLYQQRVIIPTFLRTAEDRATASDKESAHSASLVLLTETLVGLAVLLFTAMLIITPPPLSRQMYYAQTTVTPTATITFGDHPFEEDQFLVTIARPGVQSPTDALITVTLENRKKGSKPIAASITERFAGGYVFSKDALTPHGVWQVRVVEQQAGLDEAVASFTLDAPDDVEAIEELNDTRTIDLFTIVLMVVAAIIVAAAVFLYCDHQRLERLVRVMNSEKPLPSLSIVKLWIVLPVDLLAIVIIGVFLGSHGAHGNAEFIRACARAGGTWHENVPMRDGRVTSQVPVLGCTLGEGQETFHFADPREFETFARQ